MSLQVLGVANGKIRDAEILVRNPSPRLFGKKFRDSKKVNTNHAKTRLRDLPRTLLRFRDPAKIFRDPRFSRYHSPPLGSYTKDEPNFPWQNNLIILQKKVSGIHKVVNFKDFSRRLAEFKTFSRLYEPCNSKLHV